MTDNYTLKEVLSNTMEKLDSLDEKVDNGFKSVNKKIDNLTEMAVRTEGRSTTNDLEIQKLQGKVADLERRDYIMIGIAIAISTLASYGVIQYFFL